jgi:hypothetical protein
MEHKMKNAAPRPVDIRVKRLQRLSVLRGPVLGLRFTLLPVWRKAVSARCVAGAGLLVSAGRMWLAGGRAAFAASFAGRWRP